MKESEPKRKINPIRRVATRFSEKLFKKKKVPKKSIELDPERHIKASILNPADDGVPPAPERTPKPNMITIEVNGRPVQIPRGRAYTAE